MLVARNHGFPTSRKAATISISPTKRGGDNSAEPSFECLVCNLFLVRIIRLTQLIGWVMRHHISRKYRKRNFRHVNQFRHIHKCRNEEIRRCVANKFSKSRGGDRGIRPVRMKCRVSGNRPTTLSRRTIRFGPNVIPCIQMGVREMHDVYNLSRGRRGSEIRGLWTKPLTLVDLNNGRLTTN
jgi:hypothetical protein